MTYTEWRDELKSNLLNVSESERRRVLDYYAEAYADRREAGFTEREIIHDFGAPYDAAQRILCEKADDYYEDVPPTPADERTRRDIRRENREARREEQQRREDMKREEQARANTQYGYAQNPNCFANGQNGYGQYGYPPPPPQPAPAVAQRENYTWLFVLLCVIFAFPILGVIISMTVVTVSFLCAPIAIIGCGAAYIGAAIGTIVSGQVASGFCEIGIGLIIFGVGVALCPVFFKLIKVMWKLFRKFFSWLKNVFSGKEAL